MEEQLVLHKTSEPLISESSNSMTSATLGRVMNTLLTSKPNKLLHTISHLNPSPKIAPIAVSLEQSLWFLFKYIKDAAEKKSSLDQVLVPMIQHSLRFTGSKHGNQVMILLNWIFEDEICFQAIANDLEAVLTRKEDRYISLGWCTLARSLIEFEVTMDKLVTHAYQTKPMKKDITEVFVMWEWNILLLCGIRARYDALLKIFCMCMSHLVAIVRDGSTVQGEFELPTRLSVAAADLILSLTEALATNSVFSCSDDKQKAAGTGERNHPVTLLPSTSTKKKVNKVGKSSDFTGMEMKLLLWDHLDNLIILVERLTAWNRKSRPLHAKALERVHRWLLGMQENYIHIQTKADSEMLKSGVLLLSSCWKHYGMLLHLEDHKFAQQYIELLEQCLSGIQFYADNYAEESPGNKESGKETIIFFLNCLALLLGRLNGKQFETTIEEYGSRLSQAIISQLNNVDDEVIDSSLCIFKAVIFRTNSSLSKHSADLRQIDAVLPMLLHLLDERDSAAKAVIKLFAEYCSISSDTQCLEEILKRLISGSVSQKRNAVDFISDLINMSMESDTVLPPPMWQHLSCHLLEFLQDEQMVINTQASNLIPLIDPSFTLSALVCLIYSPLERVHSLASGALIALLKNYKHNPDIICMLLDCLSKPSQNPDICVTADGVEGQKPDIDRVLKLLPEWSKMLFLDFLVLSLYNVHSGKSYSKASIRMDVEDWKVMIGPLIDKLFAEPSNAVIVRFLSSISEHLASVADFVFQRLISYSRRQKDSLDEGVYPNYDAEERQLDLFNRLCPLLVMRLLPLQVFNDLNSYALYDELPTKLSTHDDECLGTQSTECVAGLLINRALSKFEFEDVRRLAAELCGRIHPKVLIPIMSYQLKNATNAKDLLKIKACLFSICTSLLVNGTDAYAHPDMFRIRKAIETILLWPSMDGDDISKAQHGCIDCLALMLCTELQATKAVKNSISSEVCFEPSIVSSGDSVTKSSVCSYVIHELVCDEDISVKLGRNEVAKAHLSFRLCMANVLISACQKVPNAIKKPYVSKVLPRVLHSVEDIVDPEVRSACIQVFFSMVYHLKSLVLPYSSNLLKASLKSLREGSEKERIAGAKLLASLMASEEAVLQNISGGLVEARALLQDICSSDPSLDVRKMCQRLLVCLISV
ncbi:uncharacterized protein LOC132634681 isoform X3 [Lycium barbarum]|uniref:uncharacterized protein LOC132634681 isoform X3 n=1 Tax=Lycium barbarum TaxID=112863 RepID=UPI00293E4036|nr:uncharacterized protein LOC132634681 isoform X3 [Lycium barbarum]